MNDAYDREFGGLILVLHFGGLELLRHELRRRTRLQSKTGPHRLDKTSGGGEGDGGHSVSPGRAIIQVCNKPLCAAMISKLPHADGEVVIMLAFHCGSKRHGFDSRSA